MVNSTVEQALNKQIALEAASSFHYLAMASWCDKEGLEGCAEFLHRQSEEEREHMLKLFHYISEMDGFAITPPIEQAQLTFESVQELFELVYKQEKKVTDSINNIVDLCYREKDHATLNFLQWYVEEQREEEAMVRMILDKIKIIGTGGQSLYYIDKELAKLNVQKAEEAVTEEN